MLEINKIDRRIVRALQQNGRASINEIAKSASISAPRAHYRLQRLLEEKIILEFYPIMDFSKLGYSAFRLMFQFSTEDESERQRFINAIATSPNCLWAAECGGRWDFLADFLEKDITCLNMLLQQIGKQFRQLDVSFDFLAISQIFDFGEKRGFSEKKDSEKKILSGTKTELDSKDLAILQSLVKNARASIKEISIGTGIHPKTIHDRLKELRKKRVLLEVKPQLNVEKLGRETFKILLSLSNNLKPKRELLCYLELLPEVIGLIETFGPWSLEIEIDVENAKKAKEFLYRIRQKFRNEIKDFELLPITKEYPYKFIPTKLPPQAKHI